MRRRNLPFTLEPCQRRKRFEDMMSEFPGKYISSFHLHPVTEEALEPFGENDCSPLIGPPFCLDFPEILFSEIDLLDLFSCFDLDFKGACLQEAKAPEYISPGRLWDTASLFVSVTSNSRVRQKISRVSSSENCDRMSPDKCRMFCPCELFPGHLLIGQIAAAVSCHADLPARFLIRLEKGDKACSVSGSHDSGSHQSCGSLRQSRSENGTGPQAFVAFLQADFLS